MSDPIENLIALAGIGLIGYFISRLATRDRKRAESAVARENERAQQAEQHAKQARERFAEKHSVLNEFVASCPTSSPVIAISKEKIVLFEDVGVRFEQIEELKPSLVTKAELIKEVTSSVKKHEVENPVSYVNPNQPGIDGAFANSIARAAQQTQAPHRIELVQELANHYQLRIELDDLVTPVRLIDFGDNHKTAIEWESRINLLIRR